MTAIPIRTKKKEERKKQEEYEIKYGYQLNVLLRTHSADGGNIKSLI